MSAFPDFTTLPLEGSTPKVTPPEAAPWSTP